jgi:hypothetical protein
VLPGALESAMFQALQQLPGLTVVRDVTDYAGRTGIATAWVNDNWEFELISGITPQALASVRTSTQYLTLLWQDFAARLPAVS